MEKIAIYLFDNMFQSEKKISAREKILVITGAVIFVISTSIAIGIQLS